MTFRFTSAGRNHTLDPGGHFARPRDAGFRDTAAADLLSLISEIEAGRPWREAVASRYELARPWLHQIITAPSRTAFFDDVLPAAATPLLDIGSGWGQIARPAAQDHIVVALEPVAERLAFIRAAAHQDGVDSRMVFIEADYFDIAFQPVFAVIVAIGVLEWAGAFQNQTDPQTRQLAFLRKTRSELAPGGCLVLGIENRIGLKYLLGCPDDHLGIPHVASLPAPLARSRWTKQSGHPLQSFTYSQHELEGMLRSAGFNTVEFFAAFPDYKLPKSIIPLGPGGSTVDDWLRRTVPPPDHNGFDGSELPAAMLTGLRTLYRRLAKANGAHPFVPSFFVRAT